MSTFRGDILQRSLHYYFLSPVRREVLGVVPVSFCTRSPDSPRRAARADPGCADSFQGHRKIPRFLEGAGGWRIVCERAADR